MPEISGEYTTKLPSTVSYKRVNDLRLSVIRQEESRVFL
jgi:hypothetical protein